MKGSRRVCTGARHSGTADQVASLKSDHSRLLESIRWYERLWTPNVNAKLANDYDKLADRAEDRAARDAVLCAALVSPF